MAHDLSAESNECADRLRSQPQAARPGGEVKRMGGVPLEVWSRVVDWLLPAVPDRRHPPEARGSSRAVKSGTGDRFGGRSDR
jgi:hypothetical protein